MHDPANVLPSQQPPHYSQSHIKPQFNHIPKTPPITLHNQLNPPYQPELQIINTHLHPHQHINLLAQIIDH
ncbi:phospho-sugar glycosidase domain-containing protein, partial [Staphylococcus saprophyticus]|uniref:phospho-sugar glycosidase domain-containing protein n=1 Tax=Staphylococcus saprophyticus TaxID=29385 RepID=UPI0021B32566